MTAGKAVRLIRSYAMIVFGNEELKKALLMGADALDDPLGAFIEEEVPFRLEEILELPEGRRTPEAVQACVDALNENIDVMFNYDELDEFLENTIAMYWGGKQNG